MKKLIAHTRRITGVEPLWRLIMHLAAPAMGMMYLIWGFNFVDTAFAGRLGDVALAGLSTGAFLMWMVFGFANLVSMGTAAIVSRRIGEHDIHEAERTAYQSLLLTVLVSLVYGAATWHFAPDIFTHLMKVTPEVHAVGWSYLRWVLLSAPFAFLFLTSGQIFFATGDTVRPMQLMVLALVVTFIFDWLFMFGNLGAPKLGTEGAGIAFAASRVAYVAVALTILLWPKPHGFTVRAHGRRRPDWNLFGRICVIGLPQAVEGVLFPLVYMFLTRYTTAHGTENVAALRIGHTVEGLIFFGSMGMGATIRPIVGQNLGAKNPRRAMDAGWTALGLLAIPASIYAAALIFAPHVVASVFASDPAVIEASSGYLRIVGWSQIFMAAELVLVGAFSGAGYTWVPMAIVIPLTLARAPLAAWLEPIMGIDGVWWAISISTIAKGVVLAFVFSLGAWTRKKV